MTRCERSGIRVVGQLPFQILFSFVMLLSEMALLSRCLRFCFIFDERISHGDRIMKSFPYEMMFMNISMSNSSLLRMFYAIFRPIPTFYPIGIFELHKQ